MKQKEYFIRGTTIVCAVALAVITVDVRPANAQGYIAPTGQQQGITPEFLELRPEDDIDIPADESVDIVVQPPGPTGADGPGSAEGAPELTNPTVRSLVSSPIPFDSRSILFAMAAVRAEQYPVEDKEAGKIRLALQAGNWDEVKAFMTSVPENEAGLLFTHIILSARASSLLPAHALALTEVYSGELTIEHLAAIAGLASSAVRVAGDDAAFLDLIESGTLHFGLTDSTRRRNTAIMLAAAGKLLESGKYLPSIDDAVKTGDVVLADHCAAYLVTKAVEAGERDRDQLIAEARRANQLVMAMTNATPGIYIVAVDRELTLLGSSSREEQAERLSEIITSNPVQAFALFSGAGTLAARTSEGVSLPALETGLRLQKLMAESLLYSSQANISEWRNHLQVFALSWLTEFQFAQSKPHNTAYLGMDVVLTYSPGERWINSIDAELAMQVLNALAGQYSRQGNVATAIPLIQKIGESDSESAAAHSGMLLGAWSLRVSGQVEDLDDLCGYSGGYRRGGSYGIPLTRPRQKRNLKKLAGLVSQLRLICGDEFDVKPAVDAFVQVHSAAEVYLREDIETVLGPIDRLSKQSVMCIAYAMLARLGKQWRVQDVQQAAQTKRKKKEIVEELIRGYELARSIIDSYVERHGDDWETKLLQGRLHFEWAEFLYGQKADLKTYTARRDKAFEAIDEAIERYTAALSGTEETTLSVMPFLGRFHIALGVSDLSYLTRQHKPDIGHVEAVAKAIRALPGDLVEIHLAMFGDRITQDLGEIAAELKPRFVRQAISIIGDHPSGEVLRRTQRYYDELLDEIRFDLRIDGDAAVGHTDPFGIFVSLRHTAMLERESGGFARYARNSQYTSYNRSPIDYRDDLTTTLKTVLEKNFEVISVTFHSGQQGSLPCEVDGWRDTHIAYVILRANDPSVDRIPSIQMDLDFADSGGPVILPVVTQVQLIDAKEARAERTKPRRMEIVQTLDDSRWEDNELKLLISVTDEGVIPSFGALFSTSFPGFKILNVEDLGLSTVPFDEKEEKIVPMCERAWEIKMSTDAEASVTPTGFRFPEPRVPVAKMTYRKYTDSELVDVGAETPLSSAKVEIETRNYWLGGIILLLTALLIARRHLSKRKTVTTRAVYRMPESVEPFTVIALLRQICADKDISLTSDERKRLMVEIEVIEKTFFDRKEGAGRSVDLGAITQKWLTAAEF